MTSDSVASSIRVDPILHSFPGCCQQPRPWGHWSLGQRWPHSTQGLALSRGQTSRPTQVIQGTTLCL